MPRSQNAIFCGAAAPDPEFDHPAGASIARLLMAELSKRCWSVAELENWRDCGWLVRCARGNESLDIVVGPYGDSESWILQIHASRCPFFLLRWLRARPSADAAEILELSRTVAEILKSAKFSQFKWLWDRLADSNKATSEPQSCHTD